MKKEECAEFLKLRGVDGFVTSVTVAKALAFSPRYIYKSVREGKLKRADRNCFAAEDVLNWVWRNPRFIARLKTIEAHQ